MKGKVKLHTFLTSHVHVGEWSAFNNHCPFDNRLGGPLKNSGHCNEEKITAAVENQTLVIHHVSSHFTDCTMLVPDIK